MPVVDENAAIRLQDVSFRWPGRSGFGFEVSHLEVARGQTMFLVGPSGSGKSTLLSLICGIVAPDSGRVEIDGEDLGALSAARRDRLRAERIGIVFQMFNLLPYASALDNVLLALAFAPGRRRRLKGREREEALRLMGALGLPSSLVATAPAAELSVGQQQRVAVARALIGDPGIIIADEPTSALDAAAQSAFLDILFDLVGDVGATLLMVSHDERLAGRFDRVASLTEIARTQMAHTGRSSAEAA
ncbi:ABC transporter ATP-binding protein [Acuticoccus mangrovi]|uniref:ABC transporter ATP-binding protein n=1 Tax=Acuticoccus mangrovi TaxID=2796142 RepID=A0A934INA0_9HYPH|nr:ABC transporter ATP-binding protein [Acuticoccus mangrovi]MBJ3777002.1 ABC transporter ATP-binding protein [Acuticoccus mangrovi]